MANRSTRNKSSPAARRRNFFRVWRVAIAPEKSNPLLPGNGEILTISSTRQDAHDGVRSPKHAQVMCSAGVPGDWCNTIFTFRSARGETYLEGVVPVGGTWLAVTMHVNRGRLKVQTLERTTDGDGPPASDFEADDETVPP